MWTFEILKKTKTDENTFELIVEFTNGAKNFKRTFYVLKGQANRTWLEGEILREVKEFENRGIFNTEIQVGPFALTPPPTPKVPPTPPVLTQDELNRQEFIINLQIYNKKKKLVDIGVLSASELTPLKDSLTSLYNDNWIETLLI